MYDKILVPMALDHGLSQQTLAIANALLKSGGEIVALHVHEAANRSAMGYVNEDMARAGYEKARELLKEKVKDFPGVKAVLVEGHTYRSIIDYATDQKVGCIVLGSHKPDLSDYLLGSTAARVVRHAPCAVHVYRNS